MYFRNRSYMDKIGLSMSCTLITYIGIVSGPTLLWDEIRDRTITRVCLMAQNAFVFLDVLLLIYVSNTRGYVKEEEYVVGGKFCYECRKAKPERAHHCSRCGRCINKMDHHCPWVGSCVNANNLGNFIKLITSVLISSVLSLFLHGYVFHKKVGMVYDTLSINIPICLIGLNIIILSFISVAVFLILLRQIRLLIKNITYLESLQIRMLNRLGISVPANPYDRGAMGNIKASLGSPKDFLLCREPENAFAFGYKEYWPPLRMTKSISNTQATLNPSV
ncbi:hypothetical protein NEPAR06_0073 [Nematocida parisii]|uniref:Palmitoyltransferase n=1 Tax=Nematocida parisii (strain ERTm3) TaxID=935791 RepID=I3EE43_NEMP3|nr:uncharacterized protein NEPG_00092 [Nematocida parisii ERTm1]EIJ87490.1 hypothetical protein NEQG_02371 [Nematocida parisii ERTm3]KAI5127061.1 hypothetical protein NEPAR08_0733 [Nematocida parisii]EIJ94570.1 hypothetical protein NEPG_00092 [Nematocida parisii ERTm1]KAI5127608.1 hypothetical protein NEPAR03_0998 [Nematocida parisii]KAI5141161.1 hypothetical protein NEPAR04_0732 [Nematocida parisii]|eukprot:XP_013057926.1 hypothetical protein NEPG_00092 [Nematocida parisii ERTm1]